MRNTDNEAKNLIGQLIGVNNWIKENPQVTEPNIEEIMRLATDFAIIARKANIEAINEGYLVDNLGNKTDHTTLVDNDTYLSVCYNELKDMAKLRNLSSNDFMTKTSGYSLYDELMKAAYRGEYLIPEDDYVASCKRNSVINITKVNFYIFNELKNNSGFVFGNINEYETLRKELDTYDKDGRVNGYLQFESDIKSQMKDVEKSFILTRKK